MVGNVAATECTGKMPLHIVSMSGGKDSLATALIALTLYPRERVRLVFADTGHEHPITLEYLDYLRGVLGPIDVVRGEFAEAMARKARYVDEKWRAEGVPDAVCDRAIEILSEPTGIPFLDLCLLKGRFPSRRAQFCTQELKVFPLTEYQLDFVDAGEWVWSWQGVRADESPNRRHLTEWQDTLPGAMGTYRPILRWTAAAVFEAAAAAGVKPNPLYRLGCKRVGCMLCINAGKEEIANAALRWPEQIDRIEEWEYLASQASKNRSTTLMHKAQTPPESKDWTPAQWWAASNIRATVQWSKTSRGGRQYDLLAPTEAPACASAYGLCE